MMVGIDSPKFWFERRFREYTMGCSGWRGEKPDRLRIVEFVGGPLDGEWRTYDGDTWRIPLPALTSMALDEPSLQPGLSIMGTYRATTDCLQARILHAMPIDHTHTAFQLRWYPD
jgi:hypothetical protein